MAGNTGAGVYHAWPTARVLIATAHIPDFRAITCAEVQCRLSLLSASVEQHFSPLTTASD